MTTRWEIRVDEANPEEEIPLTENGRIVLERRYLRKGPDGRPVETIPQMFRRVARAIAEAEKELGGDPALWEERFYQLLTSLRFLPNSPTFTGAGTPLGQLAACFTPEMRVITEHGLKRIADLQPGDRVLTHRGRYQPVLQTSRRFYRGPLRIIKVRRIGQRIEATPEHPFLTPRGWVMAADLRPGDRVAIGFPKGILPTPSFDLAETLSGEDLEVQSTPTTYVTPNAREAAQIIMPPLRSRRFIEKAFGIHLPDAGVSNNGVLRDEERVYFEIESINEIYYEGYVYNCEVEEDHTYVVEGVVVHNCFVLPLEDDMGKIPGGIFQTLRDAALIQQTGGGNGFSFSRLRPKNAIVFSSMGRATGPVGFLRVYDRAFGEIAQGGCLTPDTLVFTEKGLLRLDEIVDPEQPGWHPHHLTVLTDEGPRLSPHGYNRGRSPVLRVVTREGLTLTGTPDHKVKVWTREGWVWRRLDELQPGDAIPVILGQHRGQLQTLQPVETRHGNQVAPRLPQVLDEELAFFLGYLTGDGFVAQSEDDHRVGVSVANDSYLIEEMPRLMERLFGVRVHVRRKPGDGSTIFVIDNRAVKEFLQINGLGKGRSTQACVPRLIRLSPPSVVAAYLRGLFEADGTIRHGYPELCTASERLAHEVAVLLIGLGCPAVVRRGRPAASRKGNSTPWRVHVVSPAGLRAWAERIGCDPRSRFRTCQEHTPDEKRGLHYPLPEPSYWLSPVLEAITLPPRDRRGRGKGLKLRSTQPPLRRTLLRYLRGDRQLTLSNYIRLSEQYPEFARHAPPVGDRWFVFVQSVEPAGEALTLDLEVEQNHTYLANGMVTHNSRRGANMAVLRVDHPDIEEFITCKTDENAITNFNISVGITDAFMRAVENDEEWELRFPDVLHPAYRNFRGTLEDAERAGIPIRVYKRVRARDLFRKIATQAHHNGEPGVLFLDTANRSNPVPHLYTLEATNPCGEQWLGPFENCCLGSVNLARHVKYVNGKAEVDWEKLRETVEWATRFLDNVVQVNQYVPAVPQLKEAAFKTRRIGLGFMGLADLMYHLRIRYGSEEGQEFAAQIAEFIRYHAMRTSIELARERGPFPAIRGSIYDPEDLKWEPPKPLKPYTRDWGRPPLDWNAIVEGIRRHGIRNAAQNTVAPTGTLSTVAGCEGYGCEPVFALAYIRYVHEAEGRLELRYVSPLFMRALKEAGLDEETRARIIEEVLRKGTCQHIQELPDWIRHTFVVAQDLTPEEHVWMQASIQAFIDNSISKTINFPETATVEDVEKAYLLAWKLGCKGLTVYVAGSRQKEVLETLETKARKEQKEAAMVPAQPTLPQPVGPTVRPRPQKLAGVTYRIATPVGTAFITLNENGEGQPFEVFLNVGKAGSDIAAVAEAIGRLISLLLRLPSPVPPAERLRQVVDQLQGIGGGRALGFGPERVRSLPDGIARVLAEYLAERGLELPAAPAPAIQPALPLSEPHPGREEPRAMGPVGDICPQCGEATLLEQEGCRTCYNCGYSEC